MQSFDGSYVTAVMAVSIIICAVLFIGLTLHYTGRRSERKDRRQQGVQSQRQDPRGDTSGARSLFGSRLEHLRRRDTENAGGSRGQDPQGAAANAGQFWSSFRQTPAPEEPAIPLPAYIPRDRPPPVYQARPDNSSLTDIDLQEPPACAQSSRDRKLV